MPNKKYLSGRRYEWKVRDEWRKKGYTVIRAAGSKGPFDLIAIRPNWEVDGNTFFHHTDQESEIVLIQCKTGKSRTRALRKLEPLKAMYDGAYSVRVELV